MMKILENPKAHAIPATKEEPRLSKLPSKVWSIIIVRNVLL